MPKLVILVCGPPPGALGGGPTHMRNLWASPLASEFELVRFETGSRGAESPARDEPAAATALRLITSPWALAWRILRRRPAVVHLNTSADARGFWRETVHLAVVRLLRRPVVYQVHGGSLSRLTAARGMRAIARTVFSWPDALVVLARAEEREFAALGSARRITVVPNAVDVAACGGRREHSGRVRVLGYLGRLVDGKGLPEAIEAVGALRKEPGFEALELRIAGSGPTRPRLEAEIAGRGLGDAARLLGPLAVDRARAFLQELDVLLLPSESEGLPYVVLESLASGTPVVASAVGGIPDVVKDGEHGRLVPPRDPAAIAAALRDLAASPERLRAMSCACVRWAEQELGLDRLARQLAALYRELGAE